MNFSRVHFAFLDGCHTTDVIYEFNRISDHQLSGDVIVFAIIRPILMMV